MENQIFIIPTIIVIIIFCVIIFYYICEYINYHSNNTHVFLIDKKEHFDARIKNVSKEKCGNLCTSIIGCEGFSYDPNGICYLSKTSILGKPFNSLFSSNYNPDFYRCNKTQPIMDPTDVLAPELLKRNSLYFCSDSERGNYKLNVIAETKRAELGDFDELDKLEVPEYQVIEDFVWPVDKTDIVIGQVQDKNEYMMYEKSHDEFLGQYLYPQKCTNGISELDCLKICETDDRCIGVEWNPYYTKQKNQDSTGDQAGDVNVYENICCPKTQIAQVIPRRKEFENGNFYTKKSSDILNKDNIYITPQRTDKYLPN